MDSYNERQIRYQANPPQWGSPSDFSFSPSTVHQPSIIPQASADDPNATVEQGDEHNPTQIGNEQPGQQTDIDPTSPAPLHNQETENTDIPDISPTLQIDT